MDVARLRSRIRTIWPERTGYRIMQRLIRLSSPPPPPLLVSFICMEIIRVEISEGWIGK